MRCVLQEDTKILADYAVTPQTRLLVMKGASANGSAQLDAAAQRAAKLDRIRHAVEQMASRDGRSGFLRNRIH